MADGQKTSMKYDYGICEECNYTIKEMVKDHPRGSSDLEATAILLAFPDTTDHYLVVTPHRPTCSLHTKQRAVVALAESVIGISNQPWRSGLEPNFERPEHNG